MSSPIVSLLPNIPLSPFSRIPLLSTSFYVNVQSGQYILPNPIKKPGPGKLIITVIVGATGTLGIMWGTFPPTPYYPPYLLNDGNALNAGVLYTFELEGIPADAPINFVWNSSSSSTTTTWITLYVEYVPG